MNFNMGDGVLPLNISCLSLRNINIVEKYLIDNKLFYEELDNGKCCKLWDTSNKSWVLLEESNISFDILKRIELMIIRLEKLNQIGLD